MVKSSVKKLKVALFGYGYWGKKIAASLEKKYTVVIVDPFQADIPSHFVQSDLQQVLDDSECTICFIATPEETHFELARTLLQAGKHLWVEKPLCLYARQAEVLYQLAQKYKVLLFVDTIFYFDPLAQLIFNWLNSSSEPVIRVVSERFSQKKPRSEIAVTDDLAIHDLYLLRWWFSRHQLKLVSSKQDKRTAKVFLHMENSAGHSIPIELHYSLDQKKPSRKLELYTASSSVTWTKEEGIEQVEIYENGKVKVHTAAKMSSLDKAIDIFLNLCLKKMDTQKITNGSFFSKAGILLDTVLLHKINQVSQKHRNT